MLAYLFQPLDNAGGGFVTPSNPSAPDSGMPYGAPLSYNIPPGVESKESNADYPVS